MKFPVTLTPDEADGGFVVTFHDIPEAITQGETVEEALETAMEFYFEDKRAVPVATVSTAVIGFIRSPPSMAGTWPSAPKARCGRAHG